MRRKTDKEVKKERKCRAFGRWHTLHTYRDIYA